MYNESPTDSMSIIAELPSKVILHDMAFDGTCTRIAMACSDKTVKVYLKSDDGWVMQSLIKLQGAAAWKLKWARPQNGLILAVCSLDRIIRVYEWILNNKTGKQKYEWTIKNMMNGISVEDFKFSPGNKLGLALGIVDSTGTIQVKSISNSKTNVIDQNTTSIHEYNICKLGLNCLSWHKKIFQNDLILALGCKSHQTTPLKVLEGFKDNPNAQSRKIQPITTIILANIFETNGVFKIQKIQAPAIIQKKAVNDISWAMSNGRSFSMLAVATDNSIKIYEVHIKQLSSNSFLRGIDVLKQINLTDNACYRINWNILGTCLSVSERKKVRLFKSISRGVWAEFKQIEDK